MNVAAALVLQSIPFAGVAIAKSEHRDLFIVSYLSAVGLLFSIIAVYDDHHGSSSLIGIMTESLQ
ncbi:hypothetical protein [Methylobacterium sp. J-090]|uniref:hypothetical protein n=1 Tax=Methylobacterium sp. J-090 TaxID=2836666 RepID=UPI001FBB0417|nr:hypothetical protein [Methylobacterium sp. J-090]MCJ2081181.1 hypothetical protein [Methylobacterium sp. J-090]